MLCFFVYFVIYEPISKKNYFFLAMANPFDGETIFEFLCSVDPPKVPRMYNCMWDVRKPDGKNCNGFKLQFRLQIFGGKNPLTASNLPISKENVSEYKRVGWDY